MGKLLQVFSFLALGFVAVGSAIMPNSLIFWFTSTATLYQGARIGLAVILLLQIVTNPPRHPLFRVITGVVGAAGVLWVVQQSLYYQMPLLDALAMMGASVTVLATALERKVVLDDIVSSVRQTTRGHAHTQLVR